MSGLVDIGIGDMIKTVGSVVTDLVTTDKERIQLGLQQQELDQKGALAQVDVNKTEAQSSMLLVAGWRPAVGWVGAISLAMAYIPKSMVLTGLWTYQAIVLVANWKVGTPMPALPGFPDLGVMDVIGLLTSMLGMGIMRHREKLAGVAATGIATAAATVAARPGDQEAP